MHIYAKAPLRLGLAGGGTDVSPYSDLYGGNILNATINLYAYATITPRSDNCIIFKSLDQDVSERYEGPTEVSAGGPLTLLKGVYQRINEDFAKIKTGFELITYVDAPPGSGLGSSSTLVTAIIGAFTEWLKLPLGEYDIANLAFQIERVDLGMAGGKQDQYAATFGGFNYMEFYANNKVIVNPLRIRPNSIHELELSLVLFYTGASRLSSQIIEKQSQNIQTNKQNSLDAMHHLKEQAIQMKEALLTSRLSELGPILDFGWQHKKKMAEGITNSAIDQIYNIARSAGATGGKVSGAGGGGHMMFYCPDNKWYDVTRALASTNGEVRRFQFTQRGLITWESR